MSARILRIALDLTELEARTLKQMLTMAYGDVEADAAAFEKAVGRGAVEASERVDVKLHNAIASAWGKR